METDFGGGMKILVIGFNRSGTTLLRRLITMHPEVNKILHEEFILITYKERNAIERYLVARKINMSEDNWGDKTPYYPNIKMMPVEIYCKKWIDLFGKKDSKIINVYRHPYDVAFSINNKYRSQTFGNGISLYQKAIPRILKATINMPQVMSFKYEQLVSNPDEILPKIYKFCGLSQIDFRNKMKLWENSKYQSFDKSRVFAYKNKKIPKIKKPLDNIITELNKNLEGPEYKL